MLPRMRFFYAFWVSPGVKIFGGPQMDEKKVVKKLSFIGIFGNVILSAFKLFAGIFGHSGAMISDAVHSLSDVFATLIAYIGVILSKRDADKEHPYGHERFECIASFILGLILAATGIGIGYTGVRNLLNAKTVEIAIPTILPLIAAVVSIAVKEGMYWYTMYYAKKLDSVAFKADAWHHRSDAFSSIGSFIGIGAAKLGFPIMDPIASIIICIFILKVAFDIIKSAISQMMDTSCSEDFETSIFNFVIAQQDVKKIDLLNTRQFGNKVYIDLEIAVDRNMSLVNAHEIAERIHEGIEQNFPNVKHVMIHVNPEEEK